jgi:hypothetical protein
MPLELLNLLQLLQLGFPVMPPLSDISLQTRQVEFKGMAR